MKRKTDSLRGLLFIAWQARHKAPPALCHRESVSYDIKTFREDRHRKLCSMRTKTLCGEARAVKKEVFPKSVHSHIQVW